MVAHELAHFSTLLLLISQLTESSSGTAGQAHDHEATSTRPGTGSGNTPTTFLNASDVATCVSSTTHTFDIEERTAASTHGSSSSQTMTQDKNGFPLILTLQTEIQL